MKEDPIVAETRLVRARLLAQCNESLDQFLDYLKVAEEQDRERIVTIEALQEKRRAKAPSPASATE